MELLPNCVAYVMLELESTMEAGDHVVALCRVVGTLEWDTIGNQQVIPSLPESEAASIDQNTALYTAKLRQEGII